MGTLNEESRPEWMTDDLLVSCIRSAKNLPNDLKISLEELFVSSVVAKGENFMSRLFRAEVKYHTFGGSSDELSFVIKTSLDDVDMDYLTDKMFDREINMYKIALPEIQKTLEDSNLKTEIACRYIYSDTESCPKLLVLEDLKALGYSVSDRRQGLNLDQCKIVLEKLAKYHAASRLYYEKQKENIKEDYKIDPNKYDNHDHFQETLVTILKWRLNENLKLLSKLGQKYEKAISFNRKYDDSMKKRKIFYYSSPYDPDNKFNTIIHSDVWTNNLMFKYAENGSLIDVLFVDLQNCYHNSLVGDFLMFFFTSANLEVRRSHWQEVKLFYFNHLNASRLAIGHQGAAFTLEEFEKEMKRNVLLVQLMLSLKLKLMIAEHDDQNHESEKDAHFNLDDLNKTLLNVPEDTLYVELFLASTDRMVNDGVFGVDSA